MGNNEILTRKFYQRQIMKIIKVHITDDGSPMYLNIDHIVGFKQERLFVYPNSIWSIKETPYEIIELIRNAKDLNSIV